MITPYAEQLEISDVAGIKHRGVISAVTGFGKSVTMALVVEKLQVRTLIVVPTVTLKHQLRASFLTWFGSLDNIDIENIDSPSLRTGKHYDCLIIDEAHHSTSKTYTTLNKKFWSGIYYRFFFTATPFRSNVEENIILKSICGDIIYEVSYQMAVDKGYIVPMMAFVVDSVKFQPKGNLRSYAAMYAELIVLNLHRNNRIALSLGRLHSQGKSSLCLVKEIRHGEILSEITGFPFANGQDGNSQDLIREFNSGRMKTLIATTGVCGEGIDTKPAEYILLAGSGKSPVQFAQNIGRGFRKYPCKESCKVLLFTSPSHAWFRSHHREQIAILRDRYGCEAEVIDI